MIRINLLPQTRKQPRGTAAAGGGAAWGVIYAAVALVYVAGLVVVYMVSAGRLDEQLSQNQQRQQQINTLKQRSSRLEAVQAELEQSRELEALVGELNRARTGPTRLLLELSRILSAGPGGGPTVDPQVLDDLRQDNPLAGYNPSWDVRRLWVQSFVEEDGEARIVGRGKTNEDVAEFMRRLSLSELFQEVTLAKTEQVNEADGTFIGFELSARVRY